MASYDHKKIEKKWQQRWEEQGVYTIENTVSGKENFYTLVELPYPSGDLHVGHWYAFAVPDIFARMKRMQGYNSLYPIGFDAFGLPAENAAIKNGVDPAKWTHANIDRMRGQLKRMGNMFDWSRDVSACDPSFYRWTQWLFLQLFNRNLAYRKKELVNWCPKDQTVLANEQVIDGICERCGTSVEKKDLEQWFLRITEYADRLIDDLDDLDWPEPIKEAQRNWIGRSEGAEIDFKISSSNRVITVFTTRPDTLFGATYMVLAPEHPLIEELKDEIENWDEVYRYIDTSTKKSEIERTAEGKEKTGVELKGIKAINPANNEEIPIFVADYVLANYGTGAIMAVPAHDERDFVFARKFKLPMRTVVVEQVGERSVGGVFRRVAVAIIKNDRGEILIQKKDANGKTFHCLPGGGVDEGETYEVAILREIREETGYTDCTIVHDLGTLEANYFNHVREVQRQSLTQGFVVELVSGRQEAVQLSQREKKSNIRHEWMAAKDAARVLSGVSALAPDDWVIFQRYSSGTKLFTGSGVLIHSDLFDGLNSEKAKQKITEYVGGRVTKTFRQRDWLISRQRYWGTPIPIVYDPEGNAHAVPDEHLPWLLPTDVDFTPTGEAPLARSKELQERTERLFGKGWTPEVDTMDTFMDSSWYFLRYLDPKNDTEFCAKDLQAAWMPINRYSGGAEHTTMHILYSRFFIKALYDLGLTTENEPYTRRMNRGLILAEDGRKMSKRWGNVINPDEQVERVGSDSVKMYLAFIGPYNEVGSYPWNTNGLVGVRRFLERMWSLHERVKENASARTFEAIRNQTVRKVENDIESMKFNTSVSALMIYTNELQKATAISKEDYETLLLLLAPFAPHIAEELWEMTGHATSVHLEPWPSYDPEKAKQQTMTIAVQVDGKLRGSLEIDRDMSEGEVTAEAYKLENVSKWIEGRALNRTVYVPGRLVNFVTT